MSKIQILKNKKLLCLPCKIRKVLHPTEKQLHKWLLNVLIFLYNVFILYNNSSYI